jgi:hypothetical protein
VKQGHFRSPRAAAAASPGPASAPTTAAPRPGFGPAGGGEMGGALVAAGEGRWELNLHALTAGVAMISLYEWLVDLRERVTARGGGCLPAALAIITDAGSGSKEQVGRAAGAGRGAVLHGARRSL